jgi:poly(3-hydroxybutyrate) depolymerase
LWLTANSVLAQIAVSPFLLLPHAGRERSYLLHRPENRSRRTPVPLVIILHGGLGSGSQAEHSSHWDAVADRAVSFSPTQLGTAPSRSQSWVKSWSSIISSSP